MSQHPENTSDLEPAEPREPVAVPDSDARPSADAEAGSRAATGAGPNDAVGTGRSDGADSDYLERASVESERPDSADSASPEAAEADAEGLSVIVISPVQAAAFAAMMVVILAFGLWLGQGLRQQRRGSLAAGPLPTPVGGGVCGMGMRTHPVVGKSPVEVEGKLLDGTSVKLSDYLGQPIMLNFWATWCPPCRMEMPWMEAAYQKYKAYGFNILAVAGSEQVAPGTEAEVVGSFSSQMGLTFPILIPTNGDSAQYQYHVNALPSSFFIDRNGIVQNAFLGAFPSQGELEACLQEVVQVPN